MSLRVTVLLGWRECHICACMPMKFPQRPIHVLTSTTSACCSSSTKSMLCRVTAPLRPIWLTLLTKINIQMFYELWSVMDLWQNQSFSQHSIFGFLSLLSYCYQVKLQCAATSANSGDFLCCRLLGWRTSFDHQKKRASMMCILCMSLWILICIK